MRCMYCGKVQHWEPMTIVQRVTKPPFQYKRKINIGHACDDCIEKGHPVLFEYGQPVILDLTP